ncbi:uncharacterized protein PV06_07607 [Exophiala oligosperma]|uniref:N-acetyltransferase domain-containing protein n=2 Tax=Chaetothyriales TaxID=34395 RepID=A0A0D2DBC3_9EURO|nr:uncharacterized protein PV06_07607 [Exophiala oligosperma]KAJ9625375.1 hypothetical protein H2204_010468 [Knufia peltigerae]KIW40403.1 hypothetical protein PV06_07607 [Exophiala oligosperma]
MTSADKFTIHKLDSTASGEAIRPILSLSNYIFDTSSSPPTHHSSLDEWHRRLSKPDSIILYATPLPMSGDSSSASKDQTELEEEVLGFIFAHVKANPQISTRTLHIWLAGTTATSRGRGVFASLVTSLEQQARNRGVDMLSVCTFPETFSKMFAILQKTGWTVQAWLEDGKKVLMSKPV